jgi:maltose alpha-D-glucosyltransferase/alpha-amylase
MARQRWFATKSGRIVTATVDDRLSVGDATLSVVRVRVAGAVAGRRPGDDDGDRYVVALAPGPDLVDAFDSAAFCRALGAVVRRAGELRGERGTLVGRPSRGWLPDLPVDTPVRRIDGEQSNTSIIFGRMLIMKVFRRLVDGVNPDVEITRFLTEHTTFRNTPRLAGSLEYHDGRGAATLAMVQELVPEGRDGWRWMLDRLAAGDEALGALRQLGQRTAELHGALATPTDDRAFGAEPISRDDVTAWTEALARQVAAARRAAGRRALPDLPSGAGPALAGLLGAAKIRHHGDFHLGQTLAVREGRDFVVIDFEGEPMRPLEERRRKHTPLRDVAGMLRSFAYAAAAGARAGHDVGDWETKARAVFVEGYRNAAAAAPFVPATGEAFERAVAALELEKAAYEVVYEANHRPDWLEIPVRGFVSARAALARAAGAA